jgi:ABC-type uncharacterized transport system involved in gliding motility auxiliary subunit
MKKKEEKSAKKMMRQTRIRKGLSGMHLGVNMLLLVALWLMVNYLSVRNGFREDWSLQQSTALSPKTESLLAGLEQKITIISFMTDNFRARDEVDDLLTEIQLRTSAVDVEHVDPERDLGRTVEIQTRYQVTEPDQMILIAGDRRVVIPLELMVVMEGDEAKKMGQEPRMVGFKGESLINTALVRLTRTRRPVLYFLTGHGEKEIDNFEQTRNAYSNIKERLEEEYIDVRVLDLDSARGVPEDMDALVIAGPRTRISQPEMDLIRKYMNNNGRLMVMLDEGVESGLEPLLQHYGVQVEPDVVIETKETLLPGTVHVVKYGEHLVTRAMNGIRTIFIRPRSVVPVVDSENSADRPRFSPLASSTEAGWAEKDREQTPPRFDPGVDTAGPISIAAAVEVVGSAEGNATQGSSRLVVFGDSEFAGNWLSNGGGMLLVQHAANWLLNREELIDIPPKQVEEIRLQMDQGELNRLLLHVAVLLPLSIAAMGFVVSWRRRV